MEKHEAVVSGIMSSIGFDTLGLSEQTTKVTMLAVFVAETAASNLRSCFGC